MPAVVAPLFGFALGVLFAWAAAEEVARDESAAGTEARALVIAALFGALVYAPACGYFSAFFPDWTYAYFLDSQRRPVALDLALTLVDALSVPLGLTLVARSAAARRPAVLARAAVIPSVVGAVFVLLVLPRLRVFATHAQFHGDFGTEPVTGSPIGWALIWMTTVVTGASLWTVHVLRRLSEPPHAN